MKTQAIKIFNSKITINKNKNNKDNRRIKSKRNNKKNKIINKQATKQNMKMILIKIEFASRTAQ